MRISIILAIALLCACSNGKAGSPAPPQVDFDGERAFADLRHLTEEIGHRRIGTPQAAATRAFIRRQVESHGWTVEEDPFTCKPPEGARRKGEVHGVNLLARRAGVQEGEVWLASHYDTFDLPGFVGANDAGSSTAVLIELARQLGGEGPRQGQTIVLCWFDGEEPFAPAPWDDRTNSTFGSRHMVERLKNEGALDRITALVLLDMVGDKDLGITLESSSTGWLVAVFQRAARALGEKHIFARPQTIKDDHQPFLRESVDAVDLIDFHFGPVNEYWHDRKDTLDKCSAESLARTGRLVLAALPAIERGKR